MTTRIPALLSPPIGFAHRGASAHERENTLAAFSLATRLGASGLESDVWVTSDGIPVLDHDGVVRKRVVQRQPIREVARADLPEHIPTLAEFYAEVGPNVPVSLDVCDHKAFGPVLEVAEAAGAVENLWLCYRKLDQLERWRDLSAEVKLVHSTTLSAMDTGPERHASTLAESKIDAVNMRNPEWTGGLTTLFHRFGIYAWAWDCQHVRVINEMFDMGADAIFSDHADRIDEGLKKLSGTAQPPSV